MIMVHSPELCTICNTRQELQRILILHPNAYFTRVDKPEDIRSVLLKDSQYTYSGYTAFKDLSKEQLRYIKGSYSIGDGIIHLVYDTSRIGSIRLPAPIVGEVSYYNSIMRVDIPGNYSEDKITSHAAAIGMLARGVPQLIPLEIRLNNPVMFPILKCYTGDNWVIRDTINALQSVGVWLYIKKELQS